MPKGYPGTGKGAHSPVKKAVRGVPLKDEGADGPAKPAPSQGEAARPEKLPEGVKTAKAEAAAQVEAAKSDREIERAHEQKMSRLSQCKVSGGDLGQALALVGTSGTKEWREKLANMAGVDLAEGGHFYITRSDRGGHGSAEAQPTIWFEAETQDGEKIIVEPEAFEEFQEAVEDDATDDDVPF